MGAEGPGAMLVMGVEGSVASSAWRRRCGGRERVWVVRGRLGEVRGHFGRKELKESSTWRQGWGSVGTKEEDGGASSRG